MADCCFVDCGNARYPIAWEYWGFICRPVRNGLAPAEMFAAPRSRPTCFAAPDVVIKRQLHRLFPFSGPAAPRAPYSQHFPGPHCESSTHDVLAACPLPVSPPGLSTLCLSPESLSPDWNIPRRTITAIKRKFQVAFPDTVSRSVSASNVPSMRPREHRVPLLKLQGHEPDPTDAVAERSSSPMPLQSVPLAPAGPAMDPACHTSIVTALTKETSRRFHDFLQIVDFPTALEKSRGNRGTPCGLQPCPTTTSPVLAPTPRLSAKSRAPE